MFLLSNIFFINALIIQNYFKIINFRKIIIVDIFRIFSMIIKGWTNSNNWMNWYDIYISNKNFQNTINKYVRRMSVKRGEKNDYNK